MDLAAELDRGIACAGGLHSGSRSGEPELNVVNGNKNYRSLSPDSTSLPVVRIVSVVTTDTYGKISPGFPKVLHGKNSTLSLTTMIRPQDTSDCPAVVKKTDRTPPVAAARISPGNAEQIARVQALVLANRRLAGHFAKVYRRRAEAPASGGGTWSRPRPWGSLWRPTSSTPRSFGAKFSSYARAFICGQILHAITEATHAPLVIDLLPEVLADDNSESYDELDETTQFLGELWREISLLPAADRSILIARYGLDGKKPHTREQIAKKRQTFCLPC